MKHDLGKLRKFYELKRIYRANSVEHRKESSAEHTWSCIILADYLLSRMKRARINKLRVFELLLYHDVVEIEAGDIPIHHEAERREKEKLERKASKVLAKKLPSTVSKKFLSCFNEFEMQKTVEARFAKAIDRLDAQIHELDCRRDWKGWSGAMVKKYAGDYAEEFPEVKTLFEAVVATLHKGKYFAEDGNV